MAISHETRPKGFVGNVVFKNKVRPIRTGPNCTNGPTPDHPNHSRRVTQTEPKTGAIARD